MTMNYWEHLVNRPEPEEKIRLEDLSNDELLLLYGEQNRQYTKAVNSWNVERQIGKDPSSFSNLKAIKWQDDETSRVRKKLQETLQEIRKRGLPEDPPKE